MREKYRESKRVQKKRASIIARELALLFPGPQVSPLHYSTPFELLVAVILSAQMTDKKVNEVTKRLFKKYPSIESYSRADLRELEIDIYETGFYRAKARYLRDSARIILDMHGGKVPNTLEELTSLPGVGRKTALVVLGNIYKKVEGIAVDTHVIRLANKFKLVQSKNVKVIEQALCSLFPKKDWWDISYQLKAYGRTYSGARTKKDDPISIVLKEEGLF